MGSRAQVTALSVFAFLAMTTLVACETEEHAVLLTVAATEPLRSVEVTIVEGEGVNARRSGTRPVMDVRFGDGGTGVRIAIPFSTPTSAVVHVLATDVDRNRYATVRCYQVSGVIEDSAALARLDTTLDRDRDGFPRRTSDVCFALEGGACDPTYACDDGRGDDCDDEVPSIHPGAAETCADGIDQDCNGEDALCADRDEDGFRSCRASDSPGTCDCDDDMPSIHPGAPERSNDTTACGDGIDQNCDGVDTLCDRDGDGFPADRVTGGVPDCNDGDATINPAALERCTCDGDECPPGATPVDEDCDGLVDELEECTPDDLDRDGVVACGVAAEDVPCDCNDCDPGVYPGAIDGCADGLDSDCSGADQVCSENDHDHDGFVGRDDGGPDCDDAEARIYPGATEDCRTSDSESCGVLACEDDLDGDRYVESNCENDADRHPPPLCDLTLPACQDSLADACNGIDDDCDDTTDETRNPAVGCVFNDAQSDCARRSCAVTFATSLAHCGGCRQTCTPNGAPVADRCIDNACDCSGELGDESTPDDDIASCEMGETCCPEIGCFDLANDFAHCGACDVACDERADACTRGGCSCGDGPACLEGLLCCGGECINPASSVEHCLGCGNACGPHMVCGAAGCECNLPFLECDPDTAGCETDPRTSLSHCDGCGRVCAPPNASPVCDDRVCRIDECVAPFADCAAGASDGCETNTSTSVNACGGCGRACGTGETCASSRCTCGGTAPSSGPACTGTTACCGAACRDLANDTANCGSCGRTCGAGETCSGRDCHCGGGAGCGAGERCCGGTCRSLSSTSNCGGCGIQCGVGETCSGGRCVCGATQTMGAPACAAFTTCCGGSCVDTDEDEANCGGCGMSCLAGETCKGGDCGCGASQPRCGSGQSCCSDTCVDLDDDEAHCGSCTTNCGLGTCCSRSCADTLGDNANCGGCDMPCGTSEMCVAGICTLIVLPGPGGSE